MAATTIGTEERILTIYRETITVLYGYVSRKCNGDRTLAEDVTQETWLRAVREWRRKGVPDEPIAWLTTVARNLLASYYRRQQPVPLGSPSGGEIVAAPDDGRTRRPESPEVAVAISHALARLPADQAQLLEAFHLEDRRVSQIADSMGVSERAVEGRLRRARQSLRRELEAIMKIVGGKR
jgi:RNA polymerase sigma-70 factor (ECF subfamily)